jgi:small subunit ribosomal protein S5
MTEANQSKPEAQTQAKPVSKEAISGRPSTQSNQNRGGMGGGMRRDNRRQGGGKDRKSFNKKGPRQLEFEKRIVAIRRVSRTYSGGKRMRLSVCLVVGDKKGKVGIAMGKGADVMSAEEKAYNKAKRNMVQVELKGNTIAHQLLYKKGASKIMLRPAAPGTGVISGAALRAVLECVGIENILTKVLGSSNSINNAYACIEALQSLKSLKKNN